MTFAYGRRQHALCVLIDHSRGGKIRDAWVAKAAELRAETARAAGGDPLVVFEMIDAADAFRRLERAVSAGECPDQPDQVTTWRPTAPCCAPAWTGWPGTPLSPTLLADLPPTPLANPPRVRVSAAGPGPVPRYRRGRRAPSRRRRGGSSAPHRTGSGGPAAR